MSVDRVVGSRRFSVGVNVDTVKIGGDAPVVVQSMTNTDTANVDLTVKQVQQLANSGSELVRITVDTQKAASKVSTIRERLDALGCRVPLVGDFHYNGHQLLEQYPDCAQALAKYRINPGNVGFGDKKDRQFGIMIEKAIQYKKAIRIGVNWGSVDQRLLTRLMDDNARLLKPRHADDVLQEALIVSALDSAEMAEAIGLPDTQIILSCKVSNVQRLVQVYQELAKRCDYALHLGLTEAGMGTRGIVASTAAMAILLQQGIGDTMRISLTPEPYGERVNEVLVAQDILQSLGLRSFMPVVTACPGCGRTSSTLFQELAASIEGYVSRNITIWRQQYVGVEEMKLAVMGCVVNGPGESKHANIGISLPGSGEKPIAPVFVDGKKTVTLKGNNIADEFCHIIDEYVDNHYSRR